MQEPVLFPEEIKSDEEEASYLQKFSSYFIDLMIEVVFGLAVYLLLYKALADTITIAEPFVRYIGVIVIPIMLGYRFICIFLTGKTIGMLLCRIKYLNSKLQPLSKKEKWLAIFFTILAGIRYYKI